MDSSCIKGSPTPNLSIRNKRLSTVALASSLNAAYLAESCFDEFSGVLLPGGGVPGKGGLMGTTDSGGEGMSEQNEMDWLGLFFFCVLELNREGHGAMCFLQFHAVQVQSKKIHKLQCFLCPGLKFLQF